jgi:hypothetical protein
MSSIWNDGVNPALLGMTAVMSEDISPRRTDQLSPDVLRMLYHSDFAANRPGIGRHAFVCATGSMALSGWIGREEVFDREGWVEAGQGWTGRIDELRLNGWSKARRVVVLRRPLPNQPAAAGAVAGNPKSKRKAAQQLSLELPELIRTVAGRSKKRSSALPGPGRCRE